MSEKPTRGLASIYVLEHLACPLIRLGYMVLLLQQVKNFRVRFPTP